MRLKAEQVLKSFDPEDDVYEYEEVYDLLVEGDVWHLIVNKFRLKGFYDLYKMAVIDEESGMISLRLASFIEEE